VDTLINLLILFLTIVYSYLNLPVNVVSFFIIRALSFVNLWEIWTTNSNVNKNKVQVMSISAYSQFLESTILIAHENVLFRKTTKCFAHESK